MFICLVPTTVVQCVVNHSPMKTEKLRPLDDRMKLKKFQMENTKFVVKFIPIKIILMNCKLCFRFEHVPYLRKIVIHCSSYERRAENFAIVVFRISNQ